MPKWNFGKANEKNSLICIRETFSNSQRMKFYQAVAGIFFKTEIKISKIFLFLVLEGFEKSQAHFSEVETDN